MLVDSHCHLDFPDFAEDFEAVLERCRRAGLRHVVTICTRPRKFHEIATLAAENPGVFCTIGLHPLQVPSEMPPSIQELLAPLDETPGLIAIGESGLDYYYDGAPGEVQLERFETHLTACKEANLPIVVHSRDADDDMVAALRRNGAGRGLTGVLHCFTGGPAMAEAAVEFGFYVSFSGILTFKSAKELHAIAKDLPLERILVETDAPYLAPTPYRGKRNEPAYVLETAKFLAELRNEPLDTIREVTTENFYRLFTRANPDWRLSHDA